MGMLTPVLVHYSPDFRFVASASSLKSTLENRDYIDNTGLVLLMGPADASNLFLGGSLPTNENKNNVNDTALGDTLARYILLPSVIPGQVDRHSQYRQSNTPFALKTYPEVFNMLAHPKSTSNHATSSLNTQNEQGCDVAIGVARPPSNVVDWVVIMEETHSQAFAPVAQLRKIVLACVFGTAGFVALVVFPLAHYCITPIRKLKSATEKAIQPAAQDPQHDSMDSVNHSQFATSNSVHPQIDRVNGFFVTLKHAIYGRWRTPQDPDSEDGQRPFRVPLKVKESKHFITDELTELTSTFNEMSDELMIQYTRLEERVAERTRELEISKKAAETANESKTLFIANISHELKTPLNGILGMCAVCMGEEDLSRIKKSLKVVYKSGDLLLNLLNDLLTFSKNEFEQAIRLDEKEFNLSDIKSQILTIFDKQVQEGCVNFSVEFFGPPIIAADTFGHDNLSEKQPIVSISSPVGPPGTGRLKDMVVWGDHHRILQILINLVSNSLKFIPEGGRVEVRIRCLGDYERPRENSVKVSLESRRGSGFREQTPSFRSRETQPTFTPDHSRGREPAVNYRTLEFSFEVEDTGPGIPAHLQQKVFDPFMQGDLGLNRKYGGTGLGLSICSQLSRLMKGTISLESTVGSGSTFIVKIPLKFVKEMAPSTRSSSLTGSRPQSHVFSPDDPNSRPATGNSLSVKSVETKDSQPRLVGLSQPFFAAPPPSSQSQSQSRSATPVSAVINHADTQFQALNTTGTTSSSSSEKGSRIRVLVAEDNVVNQEVVLRMLKLENIYDVTVAKDGQEAYDIVKAAMSEGNNFDLILMDIQMPNVDGLQSTRLIREIGYSAPIVALSAFAEESNIKDCMDSGMNMFLPKPIRRPALKQMLKKFATIEEE